jgi:Fe-S-cluster containining protein
MKAVLIVFFTCFVVTACMPQSTQGTEKDTKENIMKIKRLESLQSVSPKGNYIEITVTGHGCTMLEHFGIEVEKNNDECRVSIYRIRPDFCRRTPFPITLKLPWNAKQVCGDASIKIVNAIKPHAPGLSIKNINHAITKSHINGSIK